MIYWCEQGAGWLKSVVGGAADSGVGVSEALDEAANTGNLDWTVA